MSPYVAFPEKRYICGKPYLLKSVKKTPVDADKLNRKLSKRYKKVYTVRLGNEYGVYVAFW